MGARIYVVGNKNFGVHINTEAWMTQRVLNY